MKIGKQKELVTNYNNMISETQFYDGVAPLVDFAPVEMMYAVDPLVLESKIDTTVIKDSEYYDTIMMANPTQDTPIAVAAVAAVEVGEPPVETILGNGLTNSQKWAWVIGLTFAAWALVYWTNKKSK